MAKNKQDAAAKGGKTQKGGKGGKGGADGGGDSKQQTKVKPAMKINVRHILVSPGGPLPPPPTLPKKT